MFVRLIMPEDVPAILKMARYNMETTCPNMTFDEEKCLAHINKSIETAQPTIWVVEQNREVIAFLSAGMYDYDAAEGFFTVQKVLFVEPAYRGSRAALLLMKNFVDWSKMIGAKEIIGGNDNAFNSERTTKFLGHFGFETFGYAMRRVL